MKKFNVVLLISFLITQLIGPGCTSLPNHTKSDVWKTRCPNIEVKVDNIDDRNAKEAGGYKGYKKDFVDKYKKLMKDKGIIVEGQPVNLDVSLNYVGEIGTFGQYLMCLASTPLFFLFIAGNSHNVPYIIDYSVKEPTGRSIIHNRIKGRLRGSFRGWSFFRLISRSYLYQEQAEFFAKEAAIIVFNDIAKQWNNKDTDRQSSPPQIDYRARARKIMRVEELLREAKKIYPEGKELPKLQQRLQAVKKSL